jgi:SAM-dependent methyltransferase
VSKFLMALNLNSVKFLLWAKNLGVNFNRTLTLGRQGFCYAPAELRRVVRDFNLPVTEEQIRRCLQHEPGKPHYADEFLRILGAKEIVSVDNSDFEGAAFLHDLNERFPEKMHGRFDVVIDGGTLEHVFDFASALRYVLELLAPGGHFIAMPPANQNMGHGFYQFSPELFFRVFSPENGFRLRKIILYDAWKADAVFYEVKDPALVGRVEVNSSPSLILMALAQRIPDVPMLTVRPQQSDYAALWQRNVVEKAGTPSRIGRFRNSLGPYWPYWLRLLKAKLTNRLKKGPPTLNNARGFRRLSRKEIISELAD